VKKQAGAYLTYKLVSFAADTGFGVIFLPTSEGEKEDERRAAFRRVVLSAGGLNEDNSGEVPREDTDEYFLYLPASTISKEYIDFHKDNSGCKGGWDADCAYDDFVQTVVDGNKDFSLVSSNDAEEDGDQKAEMDAVSSYDWMKALQTNMESDTMSRRKSAVVEPQKKEGAGDADTPSKKSEDVSSFFADLLAK